MSIKTSKRIALGVITALVFAPFAAIAPANAANKVVGDIKAISLAASADPTAGSEITVTATYTAAAMTGVAADTIILVGALTSVPSGGATSITAADGAVITCAVAGPCTTANVTNKHTISLPNAATIANNATGTALFKFTPPAASSGSYTLSVFHDAGTANSILDSGEVFQTITISVSSLGLAPTTQFAKSDSTTAGLNDATNTGYKVTTVGIQAVQPSGRVGVMGAFNPRFLLTRNGLAAPADAAAQNISSFFANLRFTITNPAGTAVSGFSSVGGTVAVTGRSVTGDADGIALVTADGAAGKAQTSAIWTAGKQIGGTVYFPMATPGQYRVTVWHDADLDGVVDPGEAIAEALMEAAADATPSLTFTTYGSTIPTQGDSTTENGVLMKLCMKNGTLPASLGSNETITISSPQAGLFITKASALVAPGTADAGLVKMTVTPDAATTTLTNTSFGGDGCAFINVGNGTAGGGSYTVEAVVNGGANAGARGTGSFTVRDTDTNPEAVTTAKFTSSAVVNENDGDGVVGATVAGTDSANTVADWTIKRSTATTVSASVAVGNQASTTYTALVTDTLGLITGVKGGVYYIAQSTGTTTTTATKVTWSVAMPALSSTQTNAATLTINVRTAAGNTANTRTITITNAASTATTMVTNVQTQTNAISIRAAIGSANAFTATLLDQFGAAMAGQAVTAQVTAGRNLQAVATNLLTDANGSVSYTVTDAYTGTLIFSDTLTFTSGGQSGTATLNYTTYLPTATVTVTGGASADVAPTVTYNHINAGVAGASGTLVTITATLKDANGALLPAGIPVTWAISGLDGKSAIYVNPDTGFNWSTTLTTSTGAATTRVYAWAVGTVTVTATNNAIVGTGKINFANVVDASSARVVSATAVGNLVTAKVVDRYGNGVAGVSITATRTAGAGYFGGNSASSAVAETGENGTVDFVIVGGGATVSVKTTTLNFGQTSSAAGKVGATTITVGSVGESLSPAGVQSATATVAAPAVVVPPVVYDNPTLSFVKSAGRVILSGTAVDGEGDIIIYVKRVGTTAWKERAKTLEVAAPGDFNGSIRAPKNNVLIRVKQEGTGQFSNQIIVVK